MRCFIFSLIYTSCRNSSHIDSGFIDFLLKTQSVDELKIVIIGILYGKILLRTSLIN